MFQESVKDVSRKSQGFLKKVSRVFQKVYRVFQGSFKDVSRKFEGYFKEV